MVEVAGVWRLQVSSRHTAGHDGALVYTNDTSYD